MTCRDTLVLALLLAAACGDDTPAETTEGGSSSTASSGAEGTGSSTTGADASSSTSAADSSTGDAESSSSTGTQEGCWSDLAVGEVEVLSKSFAGGSEGIAFGTDGRLIVTTIDNTVGTLWNVSPDGQAESFAELPYALGLAPTADGGFVVASLGEIMQPDGGVYRVSASGRTTPLTEEIDSPNFVAIASDGSALVSDDFDTRVFRVEDDGTVTTIIEDVPSPNGLAFSPDGSTFFVASTFSTNGELTRYDVGEDGLPIEDTAIEILHTGAGATNDGIAVDADGFVYVLANLRGEMWRVDGSATSLQEGEVIVDTLDSPASMAFGAGQGFDPCSAYVTELFGSRVVRVSLGVEGAPLHG